MRRSHLPGIQVKDVAEELDIHPFMLSRWRKNLDDADQAWVGDIIHLKVGREWCYMVIVMDEFTLQILGWSWINARA